MKSRSLRFRLITWYALWLALVFVTAGLFIYLGLRRYLEKTTAAAELQRAERVAVFLGTLRHLNNLAEEITARFAPEASGRFIRVAQWDGKTLYVSGDPYDHSFDPDLISPPRLQSGTSRVHVPGNPEMMIATLIRPGTGSSPGVIVETAESYASALIELHRLIFSLVIAFGVVGVVALGGGMVLIRRALRPVEEITLRAESITSRNLSERLPVPVTGDEFEHLSLALNRMISRLEEAFQTNQRFLADASHELRTPLTVLRGELETFAQDDRTPNDVRERVGSALEEVIRLASIVEGLFAIARLEAGEAKSHWGDFNLGQLVTSTTDHMALLAEDKQISVSCSVEETVWIRGDRARMKQVIVNLLDNAIKFTGRKGQIQLAVRRQKSVAILEVRDTGVGVPAEALPHLFERFYRVDKARSRDLGGAGLGLSIVKSICTAHGAAISAQSTPNKGSTFRVEIPISEKPATI